MSRDVFTNSEHQAGRFERSQAYDEDLRDYDEPGLSIEAEHDCPGPECIRLLCVLERVVAEQKAAR